jgi:hypothetical protein
VATVPEHVTPGTQIRDQDRSEHGIVLVQFVVFCSVEFTQFRGTEGIGLGGSDTHDVGIDCPAPPHVSGEPAYDRHEDL